MGKRLEYYCKVDDNGNLVGLNRDYFRKMLQVFRGNDVTMTISRTIKRRSNSQNSYYWGVIISTFKQLYEESTGYTFSSQEIHEDLKKRFNSLEIVSAKTGEIEKIAVSTSSLDTIDAEEYYQKCRDFALEFFDVEIPLPNEQSEIIF